MKAKNIILVALSTTLLASCGGQKINAEQAEAQLETMQAKFTKQEVDIPINVTAVSTVRIAADADTEAANVNSELHFFPSKTYIHQKVSATVSGAAQTMETWMYVRENQFILAADTGDSKVYQSTPIDTTPEDYFDNNESVLEIATSLGQAIGQAYAEFKELFDVIREIDDMKAQIEGFGGSLSWSADFETKNEGHLKGTFTAEAKKGEESISKQEAAIEFNEYVPVQVYALSTVGGKETLYASQTFDWKVGNVVYPDLSGWEQA